MAEDLVVTAVEMLDHETWEALSGLLPQLSPSAEPERSVLAHILAHEATTMLLARVDGRIVGALTLVVYPLLSGLRAHIDDVVVDEPARGRGVGEALVRSALTEAERVGARTVDLTSRPRREAAIRLYTRIGFTRRDSQLFRYDLPATA